MRNYEDADGQRRTMTEIVGEEAHFADSKPSGGGQRDTYDAPAPARPAGRPAQTEQKGGFVATPDDDISLPFDLD